MFGKRLLFIPAVLAVTIAPYFLFEDGWATGAKQQLRSLLGNSGGDETRTLDPASVGLLGHEQAPRAAGGASPSSPAAPTSQLAGAPVADLREVFRFDITPAWVTARWSRVSTTLADLRLEGLRVPLVTGTGVQDLAGSLTYYFDKHGRVQRITFHGYTGDERQLVAVATQYFGLRPEPTLGPGLYLSKWNGEPTSALRISRAPVVKASSPHSCLSVMLEINRPAEGYQLSREFHQVLKQDQF